MKAILQIILATLLLLTYAGGSGLAADNRPHCQSVRAEFGVPSYECEGWPQRTYNIVHTGSRGFLVIGLVFLAVGLISYAKRSPSTRASRSTTS